MHPTSLFVTDLDGTLLDSRRQLDSRVVDALRGAGEQGVARVVATGRSLLSARRALPADAPIDYLIFSSGAAAVAWGPEQDDGLMFSHTLDSTAVRRALEFALARGLDVMVHAPPPHSHRFGYLARPPGHPDLHHRIQGYREHAWALQASRPNCGWQGEACQVLAVSSDGAPEALVEAARSELAGLNVIRTTSPIDHRSLWLEVFPARVSKSSAAEWLARHLGITHFQTFAVGNDYNDLDLLEWAEHSAVVGNAPPELRARFAVLAGHDEAGVAEALARWFCA